MRIRFSRFSSVLIVLVIVLATVTLSGCGNNDETVDAGEPITQQLGEGFIGDLSATFERVPVGLVENNQIVNKLLSSWKEPSAQTENNLAVFDPNLVVTKSVINSELTSQEYAKGSLQKLLNDISGTVINARSSASFACGEETIQGQRVDLTVNDSYYSTATAYYLAQLYIVKDGNGYLFSMADTDQENVKNRFNSVVESLGCE